VVEPTSHPKILRTAGRGVDPAWLDEEIAELERLVEASEAVEVVARLNAIMSAPRIDSLSAQILPS
jgi:hypothetical protein